MNGLPVRRLHPALQIVLLLVLMLVGACVGSFFAVSYAYLRFGLSFHQWGQAVAVPAAYPHSWELVMVWQGAVLLLSFGGGALGVPLVLGRSWREYFAPARVPGWAPLAGGALVLVLLPLMSALVAWNAGVHFPDFLRDFERWAHAKEDQAQDLTKFLTQFTTTTRLLVGLAVVAVVPAVAEELCFRGVIQRNLVRWTRSRHAGVWLAAAIFSAIHLQFFGFVPRFVLGLLLGYLYEWSGNIAVPMAAHFTQNAFQLMLLYLAQHGQLSGGLDPDSNAALPWPLVVVSGVLSAGLLYAVHRRLAPGEPPTQMRTLGSGGAL